MNKRLEALKIIYNSQDIMGGHDEFWEAYRIIKKSLEALEIIIKKEVDIGQIPYYTNQARCAKGKYIPVDLYNQYETEGLFEERKLTEREFDLLKEVIMNDSD